MYVWREQKKEVKNSKRTKIFKILWFDIGMMTTILLIIIIVKIYFSNDLGDYIIITAICLFIYSISFKVIRDSVFFKANLVNNKYRKSVLDEESKNLILNKITEKMENKYYLSTSPSLPELSKEIGFSQNYVSQVINEKMNFAVSFYEECLF